MKFTGFARISGKQGALNEARREGRIPAVLYGPKRKPFHFFLKREELEMVLRKQAPNTLPTAVFTLEIEGKACRVLIKEMQRHRTSYLPEHIDFYELVEDLPLTVNVPIQIIGAADCAGVKLGGFVRQVIRYLKVSCLPTAIPQQIMLDVKEMQIAEVKRLSDLSLPQGVRPMARMNEVAVVIAKKV